MSFRVMQEICIAAVSKWHDDHYRDTAPPMGVEPKRPNTITHKTKWKRQRRKFK